MVDEVLHPELVITPPVVVQRGLVDEPIAVKASVPPTVSLPLTAKLVKVPRLVNEEFTTVEFNVVPVSVPAAAVTVHVLPSAHPVPLTVVVPAIALVLAAVTCPLALTVIEGMAVEEP